MTLQQIKQYLSAQLPPGWDWTLCVTGGGTYCLEIERAGGGISKAAECPNADGLPDLLAGAADYARCRECERAEKAEARDLTELHFPSY